MFHKCFLTSKILFSKLCRKNIVKKKYPRFLRVFVTKCTISKLGFSCFQTPSSLHNDLGQIPKVVVITSLSRLAKICYDYHSFMTISFERKKYFSIQLGPRSKCGEIFSNLATIMNVLYLIEKQSTIWYYSPIAYPAVKGQYFKGNGALC